MGTVLRRDYAVTIVMIAAMALMNFTVVSGYAVCLCAMLLITHAYHLPEYSALYASFHYVFPLQNFLGCRLRYIPVQISSLIIVYEYCDEQNNLLDFTTI
jgi:hypothetical protein